MAQSPAQRSFERKAALKATAAAIAAEPQGRELTAQEQMRVRLGNHVRELKQIQSIESKIARKVQILPEYDAWTKGVLLAAQEANAAAPDDIVTQVMVWAIDAQDWERALALANHALRYNLELPARFDRTLGCLIAEETAEAALKALAQAEPEAAAADIFDIDVLLEVESMTEDEDMPDQVRAKLHKAIGQLMNRRAAALDDESADGPVGGKRAAQTAALAQLKRALELNSSAGVKKDIERLQRDIDKSAPKEQNSATN